MKLFSDYHNHPLAHDPHRVYTEELLNEWVEKALEVGTTDLAFTDHDRFLKGIDIDIFEKVRDKSESVRLRMGIELDNDPESSVAGHKWTESNYDRLDFVLGSIHFIGDWPFDHPDYMDQYENWNIRKLYDTYFKEIRRIASSGIFDALAHLDLIKIFKFVPDEDLTDVLTETLDVIKKYDLAMELSTAGWHKPINELYPSEQIISMAKERNIPVTTASDAHASAHLSRNFDRLSEIMVKHGYTEVAIFEKHKRMMVGLN